MFVALPAMATANVMYLRFRKLYSALFSAEAEPSIVLAHSQWDLVLHGLGLSGRFAEGRYDSETEYAGQACARWLGDDRRKAAPWPTAGSGRWINAYWPSCPVDSSRCGFLASRAKY